MNYREQIKDKIVKQFGEPKSLDELALTVIRVIETYSETPRARPKARVVGFAWDIHYGDVSNTHECPVGGETNWGGRDEDKPQSYPGWRGRVWIRYANERKGGFGFGSDPFRITLTYPGTGGWGDYDGPFKKISTARFRRYGHRHDPECYPEPQIYSWDYRFFAADWPGLSDWREREIVLAALKGRSPSNHHRFEWWDPLTRDQDDQFLKDPETIYAIEQFKKKQAYYS